MNNNKQILLAFYGDDFTGSTDALECISRAGAKAILFTEIPTVAQLAAFPDIHVFGIAGKTRALDPVAMEQVLMPAFEKIKSIGARQVHYKVCSTFDASPTTGSIGKAIDCGKAVFNNKRIPVLGGMPSLGRYCVFGNLFAQMGTGTQGKNYRIDRHPSMSKHPVTPSDESDLRMHIGKQTSQAIGLIDVLQLDTPLEIWLDHLNDEPIVLIDALYPAQLKKIGSWLDQLSPDTIQFSVGGSGIETALGEYWKDTGLLPAPQAWPPISAVQPLLVVSGSCSPVTAGQIAWAKAHGFKEVIIDTASVVAEGSIDENTLQNVLGLLQQQQHVIVHTGSRKSNLAAAETLGTALGTLVLKAAMQIHLKRVVVAGGDTSSYAARAMHIDAVEMIAPLVTGAPLCRAYSGHKAIHGMEVNFKGGQVGPENYFSLLSNGT